MGYNVVMINWVHAKQFVSDKYVLVAILVAAALWAFAFGYIVSLLGLDVDSFVLHVNYRHEIDIIGTRADVVMMIVLLALVGVCDVAIAYMLYMRERFLSYGVAYTLVLIMASGLWVSYILSLLN